MPTKHPRIAVTRDAELAEALDSVARYFPGKRAATVVHDLALKGAEAITRERRVGDEAIAALIEMSTRRDGSLDWEILENIDRHAWDS